MSNRNQASPRAGRTQIHPDPSRPWLTAAEIDAESVIRNNDW